LLRALAACVVLCGCVTGAAAPLRVDAARADAPVISAINAGSMSGLPSWELDQQFATMSAKGVTEVRDDATWSVIEPRAPGVGGGHIYHFGGVDYGVSALARHHLTWLPILDYSTPWAASVAGDWRSPPASDAGFAAYAQAVAARYGDGGTFWQQNPQLPYEPVQTFEVWNEENATYYWDTSPDPTAYANLYLAARTAIRSVDPSAQVIVGGLTWPVLGIDATQFVDRMFATVPGLRGNVDGFGLHPYAASAAGVLAHVVSFRQALAALGEGSVPIEITEVGWVYPGLLGEAERSLNYRNLASKVARSNCGVSLIAPYDWYDPAPRLGGDWGIADQSGLRAGGQSWFAGLSSATQAPTTAPCPAQPSPSASTGPVATSMSSPPAGTGAPSPPTGTPGLTRAAIKALLLRELCPGGGAGRITAMLRHTGYPLLAHGLGAGSLALSWYGPRTHSADVHAVLIARGVTTVTRSGSKPLVLRLTPPGARLLRHTRRLPALGQASFTPLGSPTVLAQRTITLTR
jgi:hypothetical protein